MQAKRLIRKFHQVKLYFAKRTATIRQSAILDKKKAKKLTRKSKRFPKSKLTQ